LHFRKVREETQSADKKTSRPSENKRIQWRFDRRSGQTNRSTTMLEKVEVGRIKLDLVTTDVNAILDVGWLRRNRLQFR
jgi:hypothetical protein